MSISMSVSRPQEDQYLHKGLRIQLVEILRGKGIQDENVLEALGNLPRHFFVDSGLYRQAYDDVDFPIANGRIIGRPYNVARNIELLNLNKYDRVLEIGTGSCYQACAMSEMKAQVFTIENDRELFDMVGCYFFMKSYQSIKRFFGNGFIGIPSFAPFDKILIMPPMKTIPPALIEQLKPGGTIVYKQIDGSSKTLIVN